MKILMLSGLLVFLTGAAPYYSQSGPDPVLNFNADNGYDPQTIRKPIVNGDNIGKVSFNAWTSTENKWIPGAEIRGVNVGNPTSTFLPADLVFSLGGSGLQERVRFCENGFVGINTATPNARLSVNNFGIPQANIFEVLGGVSGNAQKFLLNNASDGSLRALLQGNMEVESGNLVVKNGKMGVGVEPSDLPGNHKLYVNGGVLCTELTVELKNDWPDYVFLENYPLRSFEELRQFIDQNGHLPGIPSAQEVHKNGIKTGEMFKNLVEQVEVLNLYILRQQEAIERLNRRVEILENKH